MAARLIPQLVFALGWSAGYLLWSHAYYRLIDPALRKRIGAWLGVRLVWKLRQGSSGRPIYFGPRYATWSWAIADEQESISIKEGLVYGLWMLTVPLLAGLWPVAVLLLIVLGTAFLVPLVALPVIFLIIPIYAIYWSGRYPPPGSSHS